MAETPTPDTIAQHLAWLRLYVAEMSEANWRDMRDNCELQLEKLAKELGR